MKKLKRTSIILGILALSSVLFLQFCAIADLRTDYIPTESDAEKGRDLLQEAFLKHGGPIWESLESYELTVQDTFFGFVGRNGNPYPGNGITMKAQFLPGSFDGRAIFQGNKWDQEVWGIQSWETYEMETPESPVVFKKNKDAYFWLPTYQYFIELPVRITEASVVEYAGPAEWKGKACDRVFASWNSSEPQKDVDQYVVWINTETKLIERVEYTIREMYNFLTGSVSYEDYQNYGGIFLPAYIPVESNLVRKGILHEMRFTDFKANALSPAVLLPNKTLKTFDGGKPD